MDRVRKIKTDDQMLWKHTGRGILRLRDRRVIKGGDTFYAAPWEIPTAFTDTIKPLEDYPPQAEPTAVKVGYTAIARGDSKSWFDIVDDRGKVINTKALKKKEAEEMIKTLEG